MTVLDSINDTDTIKKAFEPYYRTTLLSHETEPNKHYVPALSQSEWQKAGPLIGFPS